MMNKGDLPDIYNLWKAPFPQKFEHLLKSSTCLSTLEQSELLQLEKLYISEEALTRKGASENYHTHGVLSARVVMYTLEQNEKIENLDCFSLIAAALLHDFNGFVSKDKKFAEAMDLLESKGLVDLLGKPALDKIENLLQYTSYDKTKPINWGGSLLEGSLDEVVIAQSVPTEGLLVSYADILGQLCSPDYPTRAKELLQILDVVDPDFIPLKLLELSDKIVVALTERLNVSVPAEIKNGVLQNTAKARARYNYTFSFE